MNWKAVCMMMLGLLLAACAPEKNEPPPLPEPVEAVLHVPEKVDAGEEVTVSTTITEDGEPVDNPDEVKYEIWKDGHKENSEMLDAVSKGNGVYTLSKTFNEEAVYYVQVHVTARGLHTMPKSAFSVGNVATPAQPGKEAQ
ncbi:FixH family protein [Domibacillus indicus]|uniref:FixH family protein n=1 Tax=Domibacillus indicus TaxID=1437523 RepID=UPI00203F1C9E|nr:FixH family protein [Domibacillus indicus]MCM3787950.1 FixH family protein [Domibacillus indicus]